MSLWWLFKASLNTFFHQDLGRNLLDREMRGVDEGDIFATEQTFHFTHLELTLGEAGVAAVGLAFMADGGKAIWIDGQAEQLVAVFFSDSGSCRRSMSSSVSG